MSEHGFNFYYYYCENNHREAIVYEFVPAEEVPMYFHGAIVKFDEPLGSALSKCIDILTHVLDDAEVDGRYLFTEDIRIKYFSDIKADPLRSFLLWGLMQAPRFPDLGVIIPTKIRNYEEFLSQCASNKKQCTMKSLEEFSSQECDALHGGDTVILDIADMLRGKPVKEGDIEKIASNFPNSEELKTNIGMFLIAALGNNTSERQAIIDAIHKTNGETKTTYHVYKLNLLTDLFSATLQEVFRHGKVVKKCEQCKRYIVPLKRADEKYCNVKREEYKGKTCKEQARHSKREEREKLEASHLKRRKSIKQMLYVKYGEESDEYNNFMNESYVRLEQVRNGTMSGDEYEDWLYTFYKHKRKEKAQNHII